METNNYYYLNYSGEWSVSLDTDLVKSHNALGIEEMALEEKEVDEILGKASFCGGDLPEELMDKLEEAQKGLPKKIFFNNFVDAQKAMIFLSLQDPNSKSSVSSEPNQDWQKNWQKFYKRVELLDGKIAILPEWEKEGESCELLLRIIPGQGFGTGTHETTQLCLEWLLERPFSKVLDFGCGSGILGIATQLINSQVTCDYYDIDEAALGNCRDNIKLNKVTENFCVYSPDEKIKLNFNEYDLVFANILAPVLIEEAKFLTSLKSETLILSGLLEDQIDEVMVAYLDKYEVEAIKTRNGWVSILLRLL